MKMLLFIWVSMLGLPVQSFAEASTSYDSFLIERVECAVSVRGRRLAFRFWNVR